MKMSYESEENLEPFRFSRRKKQNRRDFSSKHVETTSSIVETEILKKNLDEKVRSIRSSYFWSQFVDNFDQWRRRRSIETSTSSFDVLSYGLGHISSSLSSQYQYALLKLIEQNWTNEIRTIFLYDPIWTKDEIDFLKNDDRSSKFDIFNENHQANQTIVRPSLIFIPFCSKPIHNNLLFSNWSNEKLKNLCFFGNSLKNFVDEIQFDRKKFVFIDESVRFVSEIRLPSFDRYVNAFNEQIFTSFDAEGSSIDDVDEKFWNVRQPPIYSVDDEILVS